MSPAGAGVGYTVVQERPEEPVNSLEAGGAETEFTAVPITDCAHVSSIVEKFRAKYAAEDVAKYYSKLDVAVLAQGR